MSSGSGPPCIATLGSIATRSSQGAPIDAAGQSTNRTRSRVRSTLSARMSRCTNDSPSVDSGHCASNCNNSASRRTPGPRRASIASSTTRCQPPNRRLSVSRAGSSAIGDGVSSAARSVIARSTRSSSEERHGSAGERPSTSSNASTTHSPSSHDQRSAGAGTSAGNAAATRASRRYIPGESGFDRPDTAFTNMRDPSARRSRDASPGEKPPACDSAVSTAEPRRSSIPMRSCAGSSPHCSRCPEAGGNARVDVADMGALSPLPGVRDPEYPR